MAIPFRTDIDFEAGRVDRLTPRIRRVIADNPGPFTFTGTGTFIIGNGEVAVIDPGPLLDDHVAAILAALDAGERVTHIFITHTHLDHSPAAKPLQNKTGAEIYAYMGVPAAPNTHFTGASPEDMPELDEDIDHDFKADRALVHGDVVAHGDWTLEAVFTPGHMANHMCYALREEKALFTGDHIMGWSTSIIAPPDGNMRAYMNSLDLLLARDDAVYYPTHGPEIDAPKPFVEAYITHRKGREQQVLDRLAAGDDNIKQMVQTVYADTDPRLHPAAALSMFAHLQDLVERGIVNCADTPSVASRYTLAKA